MVRLIQIGELFDVRETVDAESVLGVKRVAVHLVQSKCCLIGRAEFQESKSEWISISETIEDNCRHTDPRLLFAASSHGTEMASGLIEAPFLVNSFAIFATSFSSLLLSMTGIPSTTKMLSKPSSRLTWYLENKMVNAQSGLWSAIY